MDRSLCVPVLRILTSEDECPHVTEVSQEHCRPVDPAGSNLRCTCAVDPCWTQGPTLTAPSRSPMVRSPSGSTSWAMLRASVVAMSTLLGTTTRLMVSCLWMYFRMSALIYRERAVVNRALSGRGELPGLAGLRTKGAQGSTCRDESLRDLQDTVREAELVQGHVAEPAHTTGCS